MSTWVGQYARQSVADPAMGGQGGRPPPIDQNLGLALAARLRHGGKFSHKSLTFGHFFCVKMYKNLSASGGLRPLTPHQGLCPWTPLGAPPPDPRLGSRSARSPWSAHPLVKSWIRHCKIAMQYKKQNRFLYRPPYRTIFFCRRLMLENS